MEADKRKLEEELKAEFLNGESKFFE